MEQGKKKIQTKIDLLIKDMGKSTFLKLLHFVVEVMEDEHSVKILMVRRFLDIFLEFEEIVDYLYEDTIKTKGKIVTNLSVVCEEQLADQSILVVDDIRLHGRALDEITVFLIEECHCLEENISLKIFADNIDTIKVKSKYHPEIIINESVDKNKWWKVSSSIINSLYISGQPYVSHLPYFEIGPETQAADVMEEFIRSNAVGEMTTKIQKFYGVRSYLYLMDDASKQMPFVEQAMIRIYVYDRIGKIVVVPYAFLKPFGFEEVEHYYRRLCEMKIVQNDKGSLGKYDVVSPNKWLVKYLYSMETYVTSLILGKMFISDKNIQEVFWEKKIENYCFGRQFNAEAIEADSFITELMDGDEKRKFDQVDDNLLLHKSKEIEKIINQISSNSENHSSAELMLESYVKLSGRYDEKLAGQDMKRMQGLEFRQMYKRLTGTLVQDLWKTIINIVDSGKGTLSIALNKTDKKEWIDSLLFAGEQNASCNESNLVYYIYPLLEYECFCRNHSAAGDRSRTDLKKGKIEIVNLISKEFTKLRKKVNDFEIEYLIDTSISAGGLDYYRSRYPVYEQDEVLDRVLDATRFIGKG